MEVKARRVVAQHSLAISYVHAAQPPPPKPPELDLLKTADEISLVELRATADSRALSRVAAKMAVGEPHPIKNQEEVQMQG